MLPLPLLAREASDGRHASHERQASDEELMERLRAHDSEALDHLFRRYGRLVMGIAFRTLRDHGEAEDTVQDTFLYIYRRAVLFDAQKGTAKAWIVQVAFHRSLDKKSYLARRGFHLGTEIDSTDDTLSGNTDLDREVGGRLNRAKLEEAFAELPQEQRRTLELFFFEGMDMREIAGKLSESVGNVRHYYYRGLERLRKTAFVKGLRSEQIR
ncbi:MAG: polymerase sigma-70 factor, subfamily [Acidobacteriaceae bacterium]|jgi:RNA polymerase sigma-70 factor (ECF subfamily)|nr:polymerase sigma-70 factor, subfamily [Acidobacteriaceae bacterium]